MRQLLLECCTNPPQTTTAVMDEFALIERFFKRPTPHAVLGIGDDCALLRIAPGMQLAVSSDMLVQGRHFFPDVSPRALGHKALAVNLSDLAACGARPLAFTLALALPEADEAWLTPFTQGLFDLADAYACELIGGDTTQGSLNICITIFGEVPAGAALLRSGARAGHDIYVSGRLGEARLGLEVLRGQCTIPATAMQQARRRLEQPNPRVALGIALRDIASAAVDVSDGLLGDLDHVLRASKVGACIHTGFASEVPVTSCLSHVDEVLRLQYALSGGDDYELVFTAAPEQRQAIQAAAQLAQTPITRIGTIEETPGIRLLDAKGRPSVEAQQFKSFNHFA